MGTLNFGSTLIASGSLKVGSSNVQKVYKGTRLVYPSSSLDIVRDGLLFAFDWTSFNGDGTLTDRSLNGYDATYSGSLSVSASTLYFDGYSAINFKTGSFYPPWSWTVQSHGNYYPYTSSAGVNAPTGVIDYGWNQIATAYDNVNQSDVTWHMIIQVSGSNNYLWWQTGAIGQVDPQKNIVTGSLNNISLTATGKEFISGVSLNTTGSEIRTYYNDAQLPKWYWDGLPTRNFNNSATQSFGTYNVNDGAFFDQYWNALSGSIKYIAYYNRPLTTVEIANNNNFYLSGNPIPIP